MKYAIFPPIGIARVGNSPDQFFVGPETPGSLGTEITGEGAEQPVSGYKDADFSMKRQAARFRLFESDETDGSWRPAQLPAGSTVRWKVSLANKKDGVVRADAPAEEDPSQPEQVTLPASDPARENRHIQADGVAPALGQAPAALLGRYVDEDVSLGELRVDSGGNLLVLGGKGASRSPENKPIGSEPGGGGFYSNRGWYDDVSDGPVSAEISLGDGTPAVAAKSSWVIVATPDFAPQTQGVVTLYDVIFQAALDANLTALPVKPSFTNDIQPMLQRAAGLKWVSGFADPNSHWKQFSTDWQALSNVAPSSRPLRAKNAELLREIGSAGELQNFSLRKWQLDYLGKWENGDFVDDFDPAVDSPHNLSAQDLTRVVLDGAVGQGFFPGIEAGLIVANRSIYSEPFRFAPHVKAGDLTALMALPWQADFLKCDDQWWPSQRPDDAPQASNPAQMKAWIRPIATHRRLVQDVNRLGVIVSRVIDGQNVFVEVDRDPSL